MTPNQRIFANEYVRNGRNATRAYMLAYHVKNENTAAVNGAKLLKNTKIQEYIDKQIDGICDDTIAGAKEIMAYLTSVMRGEITETEINGTTHEARPSDRNKAAETLARMLGIADGIAMERLKLEREKLAIQQNQNGDVSGTLAAIVQAVRSL